MKHGLRVFLRRSPALHGGTTDEQFLTARGDGKGRRRWDAVIQALVQVGDAIRDAEGLLGHERHASGGATASSRRRRYASIDASGCLCLLLMMR